MVLLLPLLTACPMPPEPQPFSEYTPILMSRSQLEQSVVKKTPQPIVNPGKIYSYGQYILINEQYKGIHIINNLDRKRPENIAFIQVPGCMDFAVKNNMLYVDNAVDLVAINIQDINNIQTTKRVKDALPAPLSPDNLPSELLTLQDAPADAIVVGWEPKQKK